MNTKILKIIYIIFVIIFSSAGFAQILQPNIAYSDNNVRFTVITNGVIRMEWQPSANFVDNPSFLASERKYPQVTYKLKKGNWIEIETSKMKLKYKKNSGAFTAKNIQITAVKGIKPFLWEPGMKQQNNLGGTLRTLDEMDGDLQRGSVAEAKGGEKRKLEDGLLSKDGWSFIDDSNNFLFDDSNWAWVTQRKNKEGQDWYFMAYGDDYKAALKDFTVFAGKIPLPPRYAFGNWWSRYWSYSDGEFRSLVDNFHKYGIPLDVLVVDMDWHYTDEGRGGWTGWTWNKNLFPDPPKFLE
jgi:alpha-glucosidase (family GH31 glycosyl hydrolase)